MKTCKDCDSEIKGIDGMCLSHRAEMAHQLLEALEGIAAKAEGFDGLESSDVPAEDRLGQAIARHPGTVRRIIMLALVSRAAIQKARGGK